MSTTEVEPSSSATDPKLATPTDEDEAPAVEEAAPAKQEAPKEDEETPPAFDLSQALKNPAALFCGTDFQFDSKDWVPSAFQKKTPPPPPAGIFEAGILRNSASSRELLKFTSAGEEAQTLYESFQYGVQRNPQAKCLGKRGADQYEFKTYEQIAKEAAKIGSYLKGIGITSQQRVGVSGKNSPEYLTALQGCFWAGATTGTCRILAI